MSRVGGQHPGHSILPLDHNQTLEAATGMHAPRGILHAAALVAALCACKPTFPVQAGVGGGGGSPSVPTPAPSGTLVKLVLSPATVTLALRGTVQFAVSGTWSNGSTAAPAVNYSVTGGTITAGGLYTAGATTGAFSVIATQQDGTKADTSTGNVSGSGSPVATLLQLVLSPAALTLGVGATQQFAVSGTWSDGSTRVPAVTYSATGGTITAGGLYTAGTTPGVFRVLATQQGGSKADTSAVTLTSAPSPTLVRLLLFPVSIVLAAGDTRQFTVVGKLTNGSLGVPGVSYSATGGNNT